MVPYRQAEARATLKNLNLSQRRWRHIEESRQETNMTCALRNVSWLLFGEQI